ncbi:hypothetical protein HELRODRAFT_73094 [Helobdella robusta]|uniref:Solute carrier family 12 member 9 n=1 Tax=Helobdella robusta TaxID=6412 RepID=T1G198_HELRO|nr:hypothetical protein HELRODRAFT_73094 [Helobdella robusta]ESO10179.1 hypothetical protein HELRODRAFT_73094 [Helobdella robusta]
MLLNKNVRSKQTLGTFAGVFCPVAMAMFSTLLFLRLGFVLGQAGLIEALLMFMLAYLIMILTILSICAVSTNGAIEGGGAYFMISRALGPEFGGGIGFLFFLAQVVSCGLYTSGLVEALTANFGHNGTLIAVGGQGLPVSYWWNYLYSSLSLLICLTICLIGGHLYGKTNVFTFLIVIICGSSVIISMLAKGGMCVQYPTGNNKSTWALDEGTLYPNCTPNTAPYTGLSSATFKENLESSYVEDYSTGKQMNFAVVFAVLFSSVTGIMNGANMSGELKNPSKAIPRGTIGAALFTLSTFIIILLLCSATASKELLIGNYNFLLSVNLWSPFVAIGLFAATLSAALGNLIGGSRILFALAKDNIYGILLKPACVTTKNGNPVVAVLISWFLTQLVLLIGSLNNIAPMCSEMFLLAYAMTNLACLALELTSAPNFRPMFKYYSSLTSLLGLAGCIVMCFFINYVYALIALSCLIILVVALHMRGFENNWGSISQALIFHQVRKYLLLLDFRKDHIKFWRPQMLLLVANPRMSSQLIDFINDLKKSGLYIVGHVKVGNLDNDETDPLQNEYLIWVKLIEKLNAKAFVELTMSSSIRQGIHHLIRISGIGGMKPNTVCYGFYDDSMPVDTLKKFIPQTNSRKMNIMKLYTRNEMRAQEQDAFDIFNHVNTEKSFSKLEYVLMIRDAIKLKKNVCLFRHFHLLDKIKIESYSEKMFIDVWPVNFFNLNSTSVNFDKTCLFLLQLACILHMVPGWRKHTSLRIFACCQNSSSEMKRIESLLVDFLNLFRIRAEIKVVEIDDLMHHMHISSDFTSNSDPIFSDSYIQQVNEILKSQSSNTAVLFLYLPTVPDSERKQVIYYRQLELLTQEIPPTVLVHGLQPVICTSL